MSTRHCAAVQTVNALMTQEIMSLLRPDLMEMYKSTWSLGSMLSQETQAVTLPRVLLARA